MIDQLIDGWRRPGAKWLVAFTIGLLLLTYLAGLAWAEAEAIKLTVPLDIVALAQVIFTGAAACGGVFATIYLPVVNARQKRFEAQAIANQLSLAATNLALVNAQLELTKVKDNVVLIERNTNSLTKEISALSKKEGEQIGKDKERSRGQQEAQTLEEGRRQGVESERASVSAGNAPPPRPPPPPPPPASELQPVNKPIEVADDRTAKAAERSADAQERTANATENTAKKK